MFREFLVTKFPQNYPWYKKGAANLIYMAGNIRIHKRMNFLTEQDRKNLMSTVEPGDIIAVGNLRKLYSVVLRNPLTHTILYAGKNRFIHATGNGVEFTTEEHIFKKYDTLAVFRMPNETKNVTSSVIAYALDQIGKPYNFGFKESEERYFCTQLINDAYRTSGYETGLKTRDGGRIKIPLRPADFLKGNFSLVLTSENLKHIDNTLLFTQN